MKKLICFMALISLVFFIGCSSTHMVKAWRFSTYMNFPCVVGEMQLGWRDRFYALWDGKVRLMQRPISVPPNYGQSYYDSGTNITQPFGIVFGNRKLTWDEGRYGFADIDLSYWAKDGTNKETK